MTGDRRWDGGDESRIEALEAEVRRLRELHERDMIHLSESRAVRRRLRSALREAIGWSYGEDVTPERRAEIEELIS